MGVSLRVFLVLDDDSLQRLPPSRFERLFHGYPTVRVPHFSGKRVPYALAAVDLVNRKPVEILMIQYGYLTFDSEGRIDDAERQEKMRLSVDMVSRVATERESLNVVDAEYRFAKKRYDSEHKWRPSPEIEAAIVKAIFGSRT